MSADRSDDHDGEVLTDEAVRRLLTRASELETSRSARLSVAEVRDIAREAGIAPGAFEQALAEFRTRAAQAHTTAATPARKKPGQLRAVAVGALLTLGAGAGLLFALFLLRMLLP